MKIDMKFMFLFLPNTFLETNFFSTLGETTKKIPFSVDLLGFCEDLLSVDSKTQTFYKINNSPNQY